MGATLAADPDRPSPPKPPCAATRRRPGAAVRRSDTVRLEVGRVRRARAPALRRRAAVRRRSVRGRGGASPSTFAAARRSTPPRRAPFHAPERSSPPNNPRPRTIVGRADGAAWSAGALARQPGPTLTSPREADVGSTLAADPDRPSPSKPPCAATRRRPGAAVRRSDTVRLEVGRVRRARAPALRRRAAVRRRSVRGRGGASPSTFAAARRSTPPPPSTVPRPRTILAPERSSVANDRRSRGRRRLERGRPRPPTRTDADEPARSGPGLGPRRRPSDGRYSTDRRDRELVAAQGDDDRRCGAHGPLLHRAAVTRGVAP
jgi:hypothetical protein